MRYKPSTFYSNFSIAELVTKNNSPSAIVCSRGGMGGGSGGAGFHSTGSNVSRYNKTDCFSCYIKSVERNEFDESELMQPLKADIENEIINSGLNVLDSGDVPCGFYLEYNGEGIQGRIEVIGNFSGDNYFGLEAKLNETSTTEKQPLTEARNNFRQPVGDYYVVRFMPDDPRAATQEFYDRGRKAIEESTERLRQKLLADYARKDSLLGNIEYAEVYFWTPMPPEIRQRWKEAMGEELEVPEEFDQYGKVYFLNEVALRMYQEAGADFEVWKAIPADEVAKIPGPSLSGPYTAKDA